MVYGAITEHFDVAQLAIYVFWGSFAGLVYYLRREDHREGYPLVGDTGQSDPIAFPPTPAPKRFVTEHGREYSAPRPPATETFQAEQAPGWAGAPFLPKGDPLKNAVGPAAYAHNRVDHPDLLPDDGKPKLVPLRAAPAYFVAPEDVDPRHFAVIANDRKVVGEVIDLWLDRAECFIRYFEVARAPALGGGNIIIPLDFLDIRNKQREMLCAALSSAQFAGAPVLGHPDEMTPGEEDRISAYFGGGGLYGTATRAEPVI